MFLWHHFNHFYDLSQTLRYEHGQIDVRLSCALENALLEM